MDLLTTISTVEFGKFVVDTKTALVSVPIDYALYKRDDPIENAQKEIALLQEELKGIVEPDDKELIELGKLHHRYYEVRNFIFEWEKFIKNYEIVQIVNITK